MVKPTRAHADFKSASIQLLQNDGDWDKVEDKLKGPVSVHVFMDQPNLLVSDETHFITAHLTKHAFTTYRKQNKLKITESAGQHFRLTDWHLELCRVDSEEQFCSYNNVEIRLVITSMDHDVNSKLTPNSYVENIHRDNDVKLQIAKLSLEQAREATEIMDVGDLTQLESGAAKAGLQRDAHQVYETEEWNNTKVLSLYEILQKESPGSILKDYQKQELNSSFTTKEKKRDIKADRKKDTTEIKRAVEMILKNKKNKKPSQKKSTTKKGMKISEFKQYIGWYDQQRKAGKLSIGAKKASVSSKRSMSKRSMSKRTPRSQAV